MDDLTPEQRRSVARARALSGDPTVRRQLNSATRALAENPRLQPTMAEIGRSTVAGYQRLLSSVGSWVASIDWSRVSEFLLQIGEAIANLIPPNHRTLGQEYWPSLRELARDEQLCLAWAPNPELARLLVDAESSSHREAILLGHSSEVLDSCRALVTQFQAVVTDASEGLPQVLTPQLLGAAELLVEAIDCIGAGYPAPGQSLATAITDTLVGQHLNPNAGKNAHTFLKRAIKEAATRELVALALGDTLVAVESSYRGAGSWAKTGSPAESSAYSRHATVHAVGPGVFGEVVALKAVLLATSVLSLACSPVFPILLGLLSDDWIPADQPG